MVPALADGDLVIATKLNQGQITKLNPDCIVCLHHEQLGRLIKRFRSFDETTGKVMVDSDGQTGSEAAALGLIAPAAITHRARIAIGKRSLRWL